jgi:hypothetical protein
MERNEISGIEFDWFACDRDGHVALLSTAGNGLVPTSIREAAGEMDMLQEHFQVASPTRSEWEEFAALGLFVYDCGTLHEETYRRLAVPATPLRQIELPGRLARACGLFRFSDLSFAETLAIDGRTLP